MVLAKTLQDLRECDMTETKNGRSGLRTQSENSEDDFSLEGLLRKIRFNIDAEMIGLMAMQREVPHKHSKLRICPAPAAFNTEKSSRKTCEDVPHRSQKKRTKNRRILACLSKCLNRAHIAPSV